MGVRATWTPEQGRAAAVGIVRRLRDAGHTAYLAGGCVRDTLLGLTPTDFDVATDATPVAISGLFRRASAVGESFGVVLVREGGAVVEVATFRSDGPYGDGRRPDHVEFAGEVEDAHRRDFTINALFLDPLSGAEGEPAGRVIDHVGGVADLRSGVVRAVGDPAQRLREDHLRALRAVRFACRLGFAVEERTREAIVRDARALAGVSRERIGDELRRMLAHPSRGAAAELMQALGLDEPVLGRGAGEVRLEVLHGLGASGVSGDGGAGGEIGGGGTCGGGTEAEFSTALAAWALDRGDVTSGAQVPALVRAWRGRLLLSNDERDGLRRTLMGVFDTEREFGRLGVAGAKRLLASDGFGEIERVLRVRSPELAARVAARRAELERTPSGLAPEPLISGDDLVAAGFEPGPAFARWLASAYDAQLEDRVKSAGEALEFVRALADGVGGAGGGGGA